MENQTMDKQALDEEFSRKAKEIESGHAVSNLLIVIGLLGLIVIFFGSCLFTCATL